MSDTHESLLFASLQKPDEKEPSSFLPTTDQCIIHLKLLACFHKLNVEVSGRDNLFGYPDVVVTNEETKKHQAGIREKRWEVYVVRAVERFTRWWEILYNSKLGKFEEEITSHNAVKRAQEFDKALDSGTLFSIDAMPPLGMVSFLQGPG